MSKFKKAMEEWAPLLLLVLQRTWSHHQISFIHHSLSHSGNGQKRKQQMDEKGYDIAAKCSK